jgi:hypothetical protein
MPIYFVPFGVCHIVQKENGIDILIVLFFFFYGGSNLEHVEPKVLLKRL